MIAQRLIIEFPCTAGPPPLQAVAIAVRISPFHKRSKVSRYLGGNKDEVEPVPQNTNHRSHFDAELRVIIIYTFDTQSLVSFEA